MNLDLTELGRPSEPRPMQVDTPAGPMTFRLSVGGSELPAVPATLRTIGDVVLSGRWPATAGVEVSLVLVDFLGYRLREITERVPEPGEFMELDGAWGALLRTTVLRNSEPVEFEAMLSADTVWDRVDGQYLAALHVEEGAVHLTLGGPDDEGLENGAEVGWMPRRWAGLFAPDPFTRTDLGASRSDGGLVWRLPGGEGGDCHELAVAVVWGASEIATWFSVDVDPAYLREAIGDHRES